VQRVEPEAHASRAQNYRGVLGKVRSFAQAVECALADREGRCCGRSVYEEPDRRHARPITRRLARLTGCIAIRTWLRAQWWQDVCPLRRPTRASTDTLAAMTASRTSRCLQHFSARSNFPPTNSVALYSHFRARDGSGFERARIVGAFQRTPKSGVWCKQFEQRCEEFPGLGFRQRCDGLCGDRSVRFAQHSRALFLALQVLAKLAELVLDAARCVDLFTCLVVPVPGVGKIAFDAVDESVKPPGDRGVQILHQRVSGRPVVSHKALDRVRELLGMRSFHRVVGSGFKPERVPSPSSSARTGGPAAAEAV
jgi:hypothetical protein